MKKNGVDLMLFATFWEIHDLPVVQRRLFQLRNTHNKDNFIMRRLEDEMNYSGGAQLQNLDDFKLALEVVREQEEFLQINCLHFHNHFRNG